MPRIILIVLVTSLASCETVVDVALPDREPRLVASGFFTPDSLWEVHVSSSRSLLDSSLTPDIENAVVEILENGQVLATLKHAVKETLPRNPYLDQDQIFKGFYRASDHKPSPGIRYTLRVSAPGFETILAENHAPLPISVLAHSFSDSISTTRFAEHLPPLTLGEMRVKIADPAREVNYYMVRVFAETEGVFPFQFSPFSINPDLQESYFINYSNDPLDISTQGELPILQHIVFDDSFFNGETYTLAIRFLTEDLSNTWAERRITVAVSAVTEDFFRYEQTRQLYNSIRENPFAEPVRIYSNIEKGLGIFAGYTTFFIQKETQRGKMF